MRFFVTYCAMDNQLANPLWHACLVLSYWPGPGQKIEVINAWGFYAAPMANPDSITSKSKKKMGIGFDFKNNYGHLKLEEMRFLDLGYGLKGKTFAITLEQFMQLKKTCKDTMVLEDLAIVEAEASLLKQYKEKGWTIKPNSSDILFEEERIAKERGVPSRLQRFELKVSLQLGFCTKLTMKNSNTCKTRAINILREIGIDQEHLNDLTNIQQQPLFEKSMALPKYSGPLENIILYSTGPRKKHQSKRTGECTFFREWGTPNTKLYWSVPPQLIVAAKPEDSNSFTQSAELIAVIKKNLRQLQELEHVLVNAGCIKEFEATLTPFIATICELYSSFATIDSSTPESLIRERIAKAETFLQHVNKAVNGIATEEQPYDVLLTTLPLEAHKKLCTILGLHIPFESLRFAPR